VIIGRFHDRFPRLSLMLPGLDGPVEVEFIIDTGFDGALTLPSQIVRQLDAQPFSPQTHLLADGSERSSLVYRLTLAWNGEPREVEALVLENRPLIGTLFLDGCHLDIEMFEGGEVVIELPA